MIYRLSIVTWASEADQFNTELSAARDSYLAGVRPEGPTDQTAPNTPTCHTRMWSTQEFAQAWASWLFNAADTYNCNIVSIAFADSSDRS